MPSSVPRLTKPPDEGGGCANNGTAFEPFLTNIASYSFIAPALGPPNDTGHIFQDAMDNAVSWAQVNEERKGRYKNVDGQNCSRGTEWWWVIGVYPAK
ncbi:hypothetical protein BDW59DRAFT_145628 [Aspergillus cavernicola]|uniref:Uncharacterized protein n=1 Tax=Aspergillus cavernicola TaxID=176166 RepID=A0ABR4IDV5_9EURO